MTGSPDASHRCAQKVARCGRNEDGQERGPDAPTGYPHTPCPPLISWTDWPRCPAPSSVPTTLVHLSRAYRLRTAVVLSGGTLAEDEIA